MSEINVNLATERKGKCVGVLCMIDNGKFGKSGDEFVNVTDTLNRSQWFAVPKQNKAVEGMNKIGAKWER